MKITLILTISLFYCLRLFAVGPGYVTAPKNLQIAGANTEVIFRVTGQKHEIDGKIRSSNIYLINRGRPETIQRASVLRKAIILDAHLFSNNRLGVLYERDDGSVVELGYEIDPKHLSLRNISERKLADNSNGAKYVVTTAFEESAERYVYLFPKFSDNCTAADKQYRIVRTDVDSVSPILMPQMNIYEFAVRDSQNNLYGMVPIVPLESITRGYDYLVQKGDSYQVLYRAQSADNFTVPAEVKIPNQGALAQSTHVLVNKDGSLKHFVQSSYDVIFGEHTAVHATVNPLVTTYYRFGELEPESTVILNYKRIGSGLGHALILNGSFGVRVISFSQINKPQRGLWHPDCVQAFFELVR